MVANHQQLRFDLFKRFESYGLALKCNHHVARKLQRLDDGAFEIQRTRIFEVRSLFQLQVFIASLRMSLFSKRDQYDSTNTDGGDYYSSNQLDKSLLNSELVRQIMMILKGSGAKWLQHTNSLLIFDEPANGIRIISGETIPGNLKPRKKGGVQKVLVSFAYQITTMKILLKGLDPGNFGLVVVHESNLRTRIITTE
ncbi:hypothetical protein POTOM_050645 [Populus tomentosa]|uniref:Uncharacterized protein n=1 Tax=Populus tomentosa TaxID=118781 RepID=A0A8X7Y8J4_POPTO|nr:hypothetical protein POTOM_050645 [Populus tomentosa]